MKDEMLKIVYRINNIESLLSIASDEFVRLRDELEKLETSKNRLAINDKSNKPWWWEDGDEDDDEDDELPF